MGRIVVGVDPAGGSGPKNDETGIVVVGRALEQFYPLADFSCRASPQGWAERALAAFDLFRADRIVAERNFGGEMVEHTIRSVRPDAPVLLVNASRGKVLRAEPVSAVYEQHRAHHVGNLDVLEGQMVTFDPDTGLAVGEDDKPTSPDRLDALVWAMTDLMEYGNRRPAKLRFYPR
jgi:phage terminase large subunit-like protein